MYRYYYRNNALDAETCEEFLKVCKELEFQEGTLLEDHNNEPEKYRQTKVHFLKPNELISRAIWSYVLEMNELHFQTGLLGYQKAQLTKYEMGDYYNWHLDADLVNDKTGRKLSAVLQLNNPEEYEGGALQLFNGDDAPLVPPAEQGTLTVFRSTEWHRVTEVTNGTRYSIVLWSGRSD